jgi:fructokinase
VIVVAGEALVDLVPGQDDALRAHPGGGPFNTARTIGRLGQAVAFLGRLSSDRFGRTLEAMLEADGVGLGSVVHTDEPTTLALAEVDPAGAARYRFYERATSAPGLEPAAALAALPRDVAVLHVGTLGIHLEPIATAVEALVERVAGTALVVVDPNVRAGVLADPAAFRARLDRLLERADLLKLSEDDLAWLTPGMPPDQGVRSLLGGARAGVVTLGGEGALVVGSTGALRVAAPAVDVVDTIGAGDAFGGGLVAWWHMHDLRRDELGDLDTLVEATAFACRVAALTCARAGATPPTLVEVRAG